MDILTLTLAKQYTNLVATAIEPKMHSILTVTTEDTSLYGETVTATLGSYSVSGTMGNDGTVILNLEKTGTYTITCEKAYDVSVAVLYFGDYSATLTPLPVYRVWTVNIDESESDPAAACTYADDAVGMTAGSSEWDTIFGYKPCLFINGAVSKYLNPNNYAQDVNGNAVDITTLGNDVMVEFPKMGYKISRSGDIISVSLTEAPQSEGELRGFCYKPFSRNAIGDRPYFYYGAYMAYPSGNKLYSSSGKFPTSAQTDETRAIYRSKATARGTGYFQNGFYQLIYIQCLYLLKYKNRDSQAALGYGYVGGGSNTPYTGTTNTSGLNYGNTSSQTDRVKLFGIEDMWGAAWKFVDGLTTDGSRRFVVTHLPVNFDDATSGTAHTTYESGVTSDLSGYMSRVQGTTDCGFTLKAKGGSATTCWADDSATYASRIPAFGGYSNSRADAGVFALDVGYNPSDSASFLCSRLMYV